MKRLRRKRERGPSPGAIIGLTLLAAGIAAASGVQFGAPPGEEAPRDITSEVTIITVEKPALEEPNT